MTGVTRLRDIHVLASTRGEVGEILANTHAKRMPL